MYLGRGFCVVASPPACAKSKWDSMWDLSISKWKGRGSLFSPLCPQARWTPQPSRETDMWIHSVPSEIGFTRSGDRDSISRDSAPSPVLICVFLPGASHVGDSLTSYKRKREQILYEFCPQTTVLWAVSFFLILYPLWAARGNSRMIQGTGNSFSGVSFHAQGTVWVSPSLCCWGRWKYTLKLCIKAFALEAESLQSSASSALFFAIIN